MPNYLLAHDLGTSGNKATLFTPEGTLVDSVTVSYPVRFYNGNWAEQNPLDWWRAVCESTKALLSSVSPGEILAVSFSGQMMGCLCVDANGDPLMDSIIWADMRASAQEQALKDKIDPAAFYRLTGHRLSCSYGIEKLMWVRDNAPDLYKKTACVLNAKDYIVFRLTGRLVTDYSDASGTNAFDLSRLCWSDEILSAAGIAPEKFPPAVASATVVGEVTRRASEECGLAVGTPVVIGGGDGVCASVGAGSVAEGKTYHCIGSSSWICTASSKPVYDPDMRTFNWAHAVPGLVAPCGTMQAAGASFQWLKNQICTEETARAKETGGSPYDLMNEQIATSPVGSNGILFLPYLQGERSPRWNPDAKGAFLGLKLENTRADLLRSVVEGIGFNLKIILDIFRKELPIDEITVVGGMAKGDAVLRIFADIFGLPLVRPNYLDEASSMGAAVIAGVGVGVLHFSDIGRFLKRDSEIRPDPSATAEYRKRLRVFEAAYRGLLDVFPML